MGQALLGPVPTFLLRMPRDATDATHGRAGAGSCLMPLTSTVLADLLERRPVDLKAVEQELGAAKVALHVNRS